jgi:hypothetical protein
MDNTKQPDWRKRLLPGQLAMGEALAKALEVANEAYRAEAYQEDWPDADRNALNVPKWKGRAIK